MSKFLRDAGFNYKRDAFSERLAETNQYFADTYRTNVIGRDFESIITNESLFETYVERLTEGFDPAMTESLTTLLKNTQSELLRESNSLAGVQPYHSLSIPMIVKLWARLTLTQAVPTQPTKTPAFTIPFMKPYLIDSEGNEIELPEGINHTPELAIGLKQLKSEITLTSGKTTDGGYDLFTDVKGKRDVDVIDRNFSLVAVEYPDAKGGKVELNRQTIAAGTPKLNGDGNLYVKVKYVDSGSDDTFHEDTIIGHVDLEKGKLELTSLKGNATKVHILGFLSSEQHSHSTQVALRIDRKDITIGTAAHIEGSMPVEFLQDLSAMYDIDGAAVLTDTMTSTSAQKVDLDIIQFLQKAQANHGAQFTKAFDVFPTATYNMHPNEWLKGLRKTIDYLATSMRNYFKSYDAYYVIVGNPLDTDLLTDVDWQFRQVEDNVNGIDVQYSMGVIKGSNYYKVISSDLVAQGELTVFAVPTRDDYKTFVFYPYSFNLVNNYLNTRNERIPSLMMTRRYTTEEFIPMIGKVKILNNDGTQYSTAKYPGRLD